MSIAVSTITDRIRRRVLLEGIDLGDDCARAADIAREEVRGYAEEALGSSLPLVHDEESTTREVLARVTGFGVLQPYLDDPEIEEMMALIEIPQSCSSEFLRSRGQVSAGSCRS